MKLTQNEYMTLDLWLTSLNDRLNDELSETGRTDVTDVTQDRYSLLKKLAKAASSAPVEQAAPVMVPNGYVIVPTDLNSVVNMGWAYLDKAREESPLKEWAFSPAGFLAALTAAPAPSADAQDAKRYRWLANRVLACDYGDNDAPGEQIGWRIRHDLLAKNGGRQPAFMYGKSINAAIDAALSAQKEGE